MNTLLDVRGLSISFAGKEVVHGVDFTVGEGERLALVGESGSGKTVTALSLLGLAQNAVVSYVEPFIEYLDDLRRPAGPAAP